MPLAYCPDLTERTERLRQLYSRHAQDRIFAVMEMPKKAVRKFAAKHPAGPCEYPDPEQRVRFWDSLLKETRDVLDDRVPSAYLTELDQALYGGLVGGQARFMSDPAMGWISSMVPPILSTWADFEKLRRDDHGEWAQRYKSILDAFVEGSAGRFGISHFILIDSLNFVFELFGATNTYMSLDENPENVWRAIGFAYDLNAWVQDRFFDAVPLIEGGTCSNMASWAPGRVLSESVDPFHMTSPDFLVRWGIEPIERIFARYDGGFTHIHGNGRHLIETVCRIKGLHGIYLGDDKDIPRAFDVLPDLRRRAGDMPLILSVPYQDFASALRDHRLVGGALYMVQSVPDKSAANRAMDDVRRYRA